MELSTENLIKTYRVAGRSRRERKRVVNDISLHVKQGEIVGLLGPNGAGKTTTFYMMVGLVRPNSGRVLLDQQDITKQPMYRRARAGIAYLPQELSVFRNLTVEENLHLVLQMQKLTAAERKERAEMLMEDMHIARVRNNLGGKLSGGERRRVEIARALASSPRFILLDEPFTGVDPKAIEDIETIIYRLAGGNGDREKIGILITDHNVEAMLRITERAYIIAEGQKRFDGELSKLLDDPAARDAYFGERFRQHRDQMREDAEAELRKSSREWEAEEDPSLRDEADGPDDDSPKGGPDAPH